MWESIKLVGRWCLENCDNCFLILSVRLRDLHNYHTQFLSKPATDQEQEQQFRKVKAEEPAWKPVSVLTVVLDSTSRAQAHRSCGLPKTMALLRKFYHGYFDGKGTSFSKSSGPFFSKRVLKIGNYRYAFSMRKKTAPPSPLIKHFLSAPNGRGPHQLHWPPSQGVCSSN